MSFERRRAQRASAVIVVEVRDGDGFALYPTRDISSGGVYFDRAIPHPVGQRVQLSFTLPGEKKPILCDGEVVNVPDKRGYGMGVRFRQLSPADARLIDEFAKETAEGR